MSRMVDNRRAMFRFYAELNDFLREEDRFRATIVDFNGRQTVKHLAESIGVPHPEIDLIVANGQSVGFDYIVQDGDSLSIYPVFERIDIQPINHLRPTPLRETRFVLDGHVGRLAAYLRMLGFDADYKNERDDALLAAISSQEKRILLTRDRGLLKRKQVRRGYCLRSKDSYQQLLEIVTQFDLVRQIDPFTRCMACNGRLRAVEKEAILDKLESRTKQYIDDFKQCGVCGKVYWRGTHTDRMERLIARLWFDLKKTRFGK